MELEAYVAPGVFGERHIRKVKHIKIQMHEQTVKLSRPAADYSFGSTRRISDDIRQADLGDAEIFNEALLEWLNVSVGEE